MTPPYPGWRPYCLVCSTMQRMEARDYGWQCVECRNKINHELTHYTPPLGALAGPCPYRYQTNDARQSLPPAAQTD